MTIVTRSPQALILHEFDIGGRKIRVSRPASYVPSTAASTAPTAPTASHATVPVAATRTVLVKNIHPELPLVSLCRLGVCFGSIEHSAFVSLDASVYTTTPTPADTSLGPPLAARILFAEESEAKGACLAMNACSLGGLALSAELVPDVPMPRSDGGSGTRVVFGVRTPHCLIIEDMATEEESRDPDLAEDIMGGLKKYGTVRGLAYKLPPGRQGEGLLVLVYFQSLLEAEGAQIGTDKRLFAGKTLVAYLDS